ncbi:MAG: hypothetical protein Tsb0014_25080 [Pleurocapsa sp.]
MFDNQKFSNHELNDEQLNQLTSQTVEGELSDEELENVDGGYYYSPSPYLYSTPSEFGQANWDAYWYRTAISDYNHQSFIDNVIWG